jgi:hypothetical protein
MNAHLRYWLASILNFPLPILPPLELSRGVVPKQKVDFTTRCLNVLFFDGELEHTDDRPMEAKLE